MGYIRNLLEKYPDKTEIELSELLEDNYNIKISRASVGRGIRKLGWRYKKNISRPKTRDRGSERRATGV